MLEFDYEFLQKSWRILVFAQIVKATRKLKIALQQSRKTDDAPGRHEAHMIVARHCYEDSTRPECERIATEMLRTVSHSHNTCILRPVLWRVAMPAKIREMIRLGCAPAKLNSENGGEDTMEIDSNSIHQAGPEIDCEPQDEVKVLAKDNNTCADFGLFSKDWSMRNSVTIFPSDVAHEILFQTGWAAEQSKTRTAMPCRQIVLSMDGTASTAMNGRRFWIVAGPRFKTGSEALLHHQTLVREVSDQDQDTEPQWELCALTRDTLIKILKEGGCYEARQDIYQDEKKTADVLSPIDFNLVRVNSKVSTECGIEWNMRSSAIVDSDRALQSLCSGSADSEVLQTPEGTSSGAASSSISASVIIQKHVRTMSLQPGPTTFKQMPTLTCALVSFPEAEKPENPENPPPDPQLTVQIVTIRPLIARGESFDYAISKALESNCSLPSSCLTVTASRLPMWVLDDNKAIQIIVYEDDKSKHQVQRHFSWFNVRNWIIKERLSLQIKQ